MQEKQTSKLLISESPLQVLPSLAVKIGLNEAIFLQQLHYWLIKGKGGRVINGRHWIYNTVSDWNEQFPFWCQRTIKTIIKNLERKKIVLSGVYNTRTFDRTKWYSIDYDALDKYEKLALVAKG